MNSDSLTSTAILGEAGTIAQKLQRFEHRPQQVEMAEAVSAALQNRQHLIVEAGTGVGKSFGYLVPAILAATGAQRDNRMRRIVISTHTISLQEQLIAKDLPFLNSVIPREFTSVLAKGRANYLSLRRLKLAQQRMVNLFIDDRQLAELRELARWSRSTHDGSRSDLAKRPDPAVWDEVASDHANCLGRRCPTHEQCFYYSARRRLQHAQLVIVNHALFFSDLALRAENASILPDYDAVVFDEAHTLPDAAREYLGQGVGSGQIEYCLSRLFNERTGRGLMVHHEWQGGQRAVAGVRQIAREFFAEVDQWLEENRGANGRVRQAKIVDNPLTPELDELAGLVRGFGQGLKDESERQDYASASLRLETLAAALGNWLRQDDSGSVHWIERQYSRRKQPRIALRAAPIDVGPLLRKHLFQEVPSVIMTSATLAVGRARSFDYFKQNMGITKCDTKCLGSPFDYRRQVRLALMDGMPDPAGDPDGYVRLCCGVIQRYVERFDGRTFVLFTSYRMLSDVAMQMGSWLAEHDMQLLSQADGTPRTRMLELFKANPQSVLLGTSSFWQGVDVPGDALKCVIITRLPFSVPDSPVLQAQLEAITAAGGNAFFDYQVPEAIIKLRQGFGRLIRSHDDSGTVVILDPRIRTKRYGRHFVESLPACTVVEEDAISGAESIL